MVNVTSNDTYSAYYNHFFGRHLTKHMNQTALLSRNEGIRFTDQLILHVFHANIRKGSKLKMYFFMKLFLLDRLPLLNVRFFDPNHHTTFYERKIKWLRYQFFDYFKRMTNCCAGNSRLFVRAQ